MVLHDYILVQTIIKHKKPYAYGLHENNVILSGVVNKQMLHYILLINLDPWNIYRKQSNAKWWTWGGVCPRSSRSGLLSARGCSAGSSKTIWFKTWKDSVIQTKQKTIWKQPKTAQKMSCNAIIGKQKKCFYGISGLMFSIRELCRTEYCAQVKNQQNWKNLVAQASNLCLAPSLQSYTSSIIHHLPTISTSEICPTLRASH